MISRDRGTAVFEANGGRTDPRVAFVAHRGANTLWITNRGPVLGVRAGNQRAVVQTTFVGARAVNVAGARRLPGVVNSLVGDKSKWRTGIPTYAQAVQRDLYPGVDLIYHSARGPFEYDFVVAPGASPAPIALAFGGARGVRLTRSGDLMLQTPHGRLLQPKPIARQGSRSVDASYVLDHGKVRIRVGSYDRARSLLIDPELAYSRLLAGGNSNDSASAIAVDNSGNSYITGRTDSSDFPTNSAADSSPGGGADAFVLKLSADGQTRLYSTYIGGNNADYGEGIAVDGLGRAVVGGYTGSTTGFPSGTAIGPGGGDDAFVLRLAASGSSIEKLARIGGTAADDAFDVALDSTGNKAYLVGNTYSTNFPTTAGGKQLTNGGSADAFLSVVDLSATPAQTYATYLGGTGFDRAYGVAVGSDGRAYLGGSTSSAAFPTATPWSDGQTPGGGVSQGGQDAFLSKINPTASGSASLVYSSYFGGAGADYGDDVAVNSAGEAYMTGTTTSVNTTFPTSFALSGHSNNAGGYDAFVMKMRNDGAALLMSTFLGGAGDEYADDENGIAVDAQGNVTVTGHTTSTSATFPVVRAIQGENNGDDAYVTKIKPGNTLPVFSTFFGGGGGESGAGVALDGQGGVYVVGSTGSTSDFPIVGASSAPTTSGDTYAMKIQSPRAATITSGPTGPVGANTGTFGFTLPATETQATFQCRVDSAAFAACSSPHTTPGLGDGGHTFDVRPLDFGGTPGPTASQGFTTDTTGPTAPQLISPGSGETAGAAPAFSWSASSDATSGVAGYTLVVDGAGVAQAGGDCSGTCSVGPASPIADGARTWRIDARDAAGNVSSSETRPFTVAQAPTASFVANPNPALVGRSVSFDASGSTDNSAVTRYEWDLDGDGAFETDTGSDPKTSRAYPAKATVNVGVRVSDAAGLSGTATRSLTVNSPSNTPPQFGVSVNKGAQFTNDPNVKLALKFPLITSSVLVSNDGGFDDPKTFLPVAEVPWKLASSGPERLPKTVYVRFLPSLIAGLTFTDDIILDETPPVIQSATLSGAAASSARVHAAATRKFTVKVKAKDKTSGVGSVQVTANKKKPGKLLKYKKKVSVKSASRPRWIRVRDRAKNYSRWRKLH